MGSVNTGGVTWQEDILPGKTKKALRFLAQQSWLKQADWYLAGGTALALQVGHRQSVDLDFFTPRKNFLPAEVIGKFPESEWVTEIGREGTVYGKLQGAKVSFIAYPFFKTAEEPGWFGNVRVLSPRDIAVMKIIAISQRGRKRDFVDLCWYVKNQEPLIDILRRVPEQYATVTHDFHHILKALMYFKDADEDPMPEIFFAVSWKGIKQYFQQEVSKLAKLMLT